MIMYHLTNYEFKIGDVVLPQSTGYTHWVESCALETVLETVLERYRPKEKISRKECIFLTKEKPKNKDYGASGTSFILTVEVDEEVINQFSDMNHFFCIDQGFEDVIHLEDDYLEEELKKIADQYWSGMSSKTPRIEYRSKQGVILSIEQKKTFFKVFFNFFILPKDLHLEHHKK